MEKRKPGGFLPPGALKWALGAVAVHMPVLFCLWMFAFSGVLRLPVGLYLLSSNLFLADGAVLTLYLLWRAVYFFRARYSYDCPWRQTDGAVRSLAALALLSASLLLLPELSGGFVGGKEVADLAVVTGYDLGTGDRFPMGERRQSVLLEVVELVDMATFCEGRYDCRFPWLSRLVTEGLRIFTFSGLVPAELGFDASYLHPDAGSILLRQGGTVFYLSGVDCADEETLSVIREKLELEVAS